MKNVLKVSESGYLSTTIVEAKQTKTPRYGMTREGYSIKSGAPTSVMILLKGETRWRRLMCWQFSNAGTCFIKSKKKDIIVAEHDIPKFS